MTSRRALAAAFVAAAIATSFSAKSLSAAFFAWRVADVSADDVLMVRAGPGSGSPILVGYPSGVTLSMTGQCTGGLSLDDISHLPYAEQRARVRSEWCEVWLDPYGTGDFRSGWVFGPYIEPL
jgi:hypothetical protein